MYCNNTQKANYSKVASNLIGENKYNINILEYLNTHGNEPTTITMMVTTYTQNSGSLNKNNKVPQDKSIKPVVKA